MKKFAVFSGFLGSGKTTTMMALTQYYTRSHAKAAMISNDLGHGVNLADNRFAQLCGCFHSQKCIMESPSSTTSTCFPLNFSISRCRLRNRFAHQ